LRDYKKGGAQTETTLLILLSLYQINHGYQIMQFINEQTNGRVNLGAGTLYGALKTLEKKGWITKAEITEEGRKNYLITDEGKHIVESEITRLTQLLSLTQQIIGCNDYEEN